jgi:hypothetical protein
MDLPRERLKGPRRATRSGREVALLPALEESESNNYRATINNAQRSLNQVGARRAGDDDETKQCAEAFIVFNYRQSFQSGASKRVRLERE